MPPDDTTEQDESLEDTQEPWEDIYRDRGFLTKDDREYLVGERDLEGQHERNTRYRIRNRTIHGLQDVALFQRYSGPHLKDLRQLANSEELSSQSLRVGLISLVYDLMMFDDDATDLISEFEDLIETTIHNEHPYEEMGAYDGVFKERVVSVDIQIEDRTQDIEIIEEKIREGTANVYEASIYKEIGEDNELVEQARQMIRDHYQDYRSE